MKKVVLKDRINYYDQNFYGNYSLLRFCFYNDGVWFYYEYDWRDNMTKCIDNLKQWRKRNDIREPNW